MIKIELPLKWATSQEEIVAFLAFGIVSAI